MKNVRVYHSTGIEQNVDNHNFAQRSLEVRAQRHKNNINTLYIINLFIQPFCMSLKHLFYCDWKAPWHGPMFLLILLDVFWEDSSHSDNYLTRTGWDELHTALDTLGVTWKQRPVQRFRVDKLLEFVCCQVLVARRFLKGLSGLSIGWWCLQLH